MPLKRGADGRLGVSGGGSAPVNVTVNVDASGNSQVAGDQNQGAQLGRVIAGAVQQELLNQRRPGGLLSGMR
jgi:phage-related minor tail protein